MALHSIARAGVPHPLAAILPDRSRRDARAGRLLAHELGHTLVLVHGDDLGGAPTPELAPLTITTTGVTS